MVQLPRNLSKKDNDRQAASGWWMEDMHEGYALQHVGTVLAVRGGSEYLRLGQQFGHGIPSEAAWGINTPADYEPAWNAPVRNVYSTDSIEIIRQRLANANDYFKRKATEVVSDDSALRLLATLYEAVVVDISEFDSCKDGLSLAKLTAANFCEVGANVIYITESGQRFIDSIKGA